MAFSLLNPIEQEILLQIKKKVNLLKGVKSESEFLDIQLGYLVACINDRLTKWREDCVEETARMRMVVMRALAHDMEDCLERFLYRVRQKEKAGTLDGWVPLSWLMGKKVVRIGKLAKKMKKLRKRLEEVNNLVQLPANAAGPQAESESEPVTQKPVGFSRATEKLVGLLNMTGRDPERLRVITILGFGGSGKTTLANQVYARTRPDGVAGFPLRAWITRAEYSDASGLLGKIINEFWGDAAKEATREFSVRGLQGYIKDNLPGQRYLIVLDDVDNKDHWSWVMNTLDAESGEGSRIIVITRFRSISNQCRKHGSDSYVYQMRAIGDNACKLISGLDDDHQHSEKLLKTCGGHPLALSSVDKHFISIDGMRTPNNCKALCDNLGKFLHDAKKDHRKDFKGLRSVLMDNLVGLDVSTDRSCLLYLGIFPNGCPIKRSRLTRRWIAEGYAAGDSISKFIERNIIQPIGIRYSSKEWKVCETLSILQEFALHKSISDNFIMAVDDGPPDDLASSIGNKKNRKVRHISVNVSGVEASGTTDLSCVRSLTISKKAGLGGAFSKFSEYDILRVLDMEDCCDEKLNGTHLSDICNLWNLRYLSLGTNIIKLPGQFVENLELLESLHLSKEEVSELPVQVIWMPSLKHLIGKIKFMYDKDKAALVQSQKSKLETIAGAVASAEEKGFLVDMMPHMKNLRKVKIWCISNGNIKSLDTQLLQAIMWYTKCNMQRSLSIDFKGLSPDDMKKLQNHGRHANHYKFFEETTSNESYLSSLKLQGALLSSIPRFLANLSGLTMLCLSLTILAKDHLSLLSKVKTLVHLKLIAVHIDSNTLVIPVQGFEELRSLCFKVTGSSAAELKINIDRSTVRGNGEILFPLPKMVSLQLLCEELPHPSGMQITQFTKLQEIELDKKFKGDARRIPWEQEAWNHPNRPNVLPLEFFDDGETAASEQPAAPGVTNVPPVVDIPDATAARDESILTTPPRFLKNVVSKLWNFIEQARQSVTVPGEAVL